MAPDKSLAAEIEARAGKAQAGLARAYELIADQYGTWSPEAGTQFTDRGAAEAVEGIRLARELLAEIAALQSRDGLIAFARWAIECAFDGQDADGADIQAVALHHGLLSKSPYDPEKHGPSFEAEPGEDWYTLAGPLALAEQEKGDA